MLSKIKNRGAVTGYANLPDNKKQIIKEFVQNQFLKADTLTVEEQITNIELALVEIYEVMLNG